MAEIVKGSPEWWLDELYGRMLARRATIDKYEAYYAGRHKLAFATPKFRDTFGNLFKAFADNWCDLIVEASVERLEVQGFRLGDSQEADDAAWEVWQRNYLDGGREAWRRRRDRHAGGRTPHFGRASVAGHCRGRPRRPAQARRRPEGLVGRHRPPVRNGVPAEWRLQVPVGQDGRQGGRHDGRVGGA